MKRLLLVAALVVLMASQADARKLKEKKLRPLTTEQLTALHIDEKAKVDRKALHKVLREHLQEDDLETLRNAWYYSCSQQVISVDLAPMSLMEVISEKSALLYGRVTAMASIREQIIEQIIRRVVEGVEFTVTVDVKEAIPAIETRTVHLHASVGHEFVDAIKEGVEYLFVACLESDGSYSFFPCLGTRPVVDGRVEGMPVHTAMQMFGRRYEQVMGELGPEAVVTTDDFKTDDAGTVLAALQLVDLTPDANVPMDAILDTVARLYENVVLASRSNNLPFIRVVDMVMGILGKKSQPETIKRMLDLYTADIERPGSIFYRNGLDAPVVGMALALSAPQRGEALTRLFSPQFRVSGEKDDVSFSGLRSYVQPLAILFSPTFQVLADTPGEDIDRLFQDMVDHREKYVFSGQMEQTAIRTALSKRSAGE